MARRSLTASVSGIKKAKLAFKRKGWTQDYLAAEVGLQTRQPVWKFFTGKPVDRHVFIEICFVLDLIPEEIAIPPEVEEAGTDELEGTEAPVPDLNAVVQQVKQARSEKIHHLCGTLRMLDVARPIDLDYIFVDVNIWEEISNQRWLEMSDFQEISLPEFDQKHQQTRILGQQAIANHSQLIVLGKPGSGKTTFLQSLAMQCDRNQLLSDCIPMFIRLKSFAEDALDENNFNFLNYLQREFTPFSVSHQTLELLLNDGRLLLLLDGLDEVPEAANEEIIKQIRKFSEQYYKNQLILSCRLAGYQYQLPGFTEVEVADFNTDQIALFVEKWFVTVARSSSGEAQAKANLFMEQLLLSENWQLRELAGTPILLNLICLVFQSKNSFPSNRAKLYEKGLDILLVRWDELRGIKRDDIYRNLSLPRKLKLLSNIAEKSFEKGYYFFEQDYICRQIADCLESLEMVNSTSEDLLLISESVLRSIEVQHGILVEQARAIYSFSHLTFQEYLTSREIATQPQSWAKLVEHLYEPRWREVFILTSEILPKADNFLRLIQQEILALVDADPKIRHFLDRIKQKAVELQIAQDLMVIRVFLMTLNLERERALNQTQNRGIVLACALVRDITLDLDLGRILSSNPVLDLDLAQITARNLASELNTDLRRGLELTGTRMLVLTSTLGRELLAIADRVFDPSREMPLRQLHQQLPPIQEPLNVHQHWWETQGDAWIEALRNWAIASRNIGHRWELSDRQLEILQKYYSASRLLLDCLQTVTAITPSFRDELEENLF